MTIDEYLDHLREAGKARTTVETYAAVLRRLDRDLPFGLTSATAEEIKAAAFTSERAHATRALYRAAVSGFFAWACDPTYPRLDFNPALYLPRQRVPRRRARPAGTDALADVLTRAQDPYRLWYMLATYAGLRCCEITVLDRRHIDQDEMLVRGKGDKERRVPTHPLIWAEVEHLPAGRIASRDRTPGRQYVSKAGNRHLTALGHPELTMHRLRHWYATHAQRAGHNLRITQELLGHASPATTAGYTAVDMEEMRGAVLGLPDLVSPAGGDVA